MKRHLMLSLLLISAALFAAAEKLTVIGTTDIHGQLFSGKDKPNLLKPVRFPMKSPPPGKRILW